MAGGIIRGTQIQDHTITAQQIAASTITALELADAAITSDAIDQWAVTQFALFPGSVGSNQLGIGAVTPLHLNIPVIDSSGNLISGSVGPNQIQNGAIRPVALNIPILDANGNLVSGSVTGDAIAFGTITAANIAANTFTAATIAAGSITGNQIQSNTITTLQIAANTITAANIAAATITAGQIAAGTITAANMVAGTLTGDTIAANTITGANIQANSITAANAVFGIAAIVAADILSCSISSLTVGQLQFDMTLSPGGGTITTGGPTAKITLSNTGFNAYDSTGAPTVTIDAATGTAVFKGTVTGSEIIGSDYIASAVGTTLPNIAMGPNNLGVFGSSQFPSIVFNTSTTSHYNTFLPSILYPETTGVPNYFMLITAGSSTLDGATTPAQVVLYSTNDSLNAGYAIFSGNRVILQSTAGAIIYRANRSQSVYLLSGIANANTVTTDSSGGVTISFGSTPMDTASYAPSIISSNGAQALTFQLVSRSTTAFSFFVWSGASKLLNTAINVYWSVVNTP